jgi:hypothetical protein
MSCYSLTDNRQLDDSSVNVCKGDLSEAHE